MKKPLSFVTLLAFAALILTSCGGLASPKNETGRFEFKVTDEMITAISRAVTVTDDTTCTITLHLYSTDGNSYYKEQTRSDRLSALKGSTFDPFTDIPLGIELNLTVDVKTGGELVFTSAAKKFTLTETDANPTLRIQMNRVNCEMNTPYIIPREIEPTTGQGKLLLIPSKTSFSSETESLNEKADRKIEISYLASYCYCCDVNDALWFIDWDPEPPLLCVTDSSGTTKSVTVPDETFYLEAVTHDSITNLICLLCSTWTQTGTNQQGNPEGYSTYYIKTINPAAYKNWGSTLTLTKNELIELDEYVRADCISAYNGYYYALKTDELTYSNEGASAILRKYALENKDGHKAGERVKTGTVHLDRINPLEGAYFEDNSICNDDYLNARNTGGENNSYDSGRFFFNDMAVYDDSVYILFHQEEFWAEPGTYQYNGYLNPKAYEFNQSYLQNGGYINRGGILVIDTDTLTTKGTLGLTEVADSLQLPLIGYRDWKTQDYKSLGSTFAFFYEDSAMTKVAKGEFQLKFALPEWNSKTINFSNPIKIVAVKPKKLVVADSGTFLFIDDDRDADGNPVIKEESEFNDGLSYIHVKKGSRLITVNLEDFSKSEVTTVFGEDAAPVYFNDPSIGLKKGLFNLRYTATSNDASVYYYPEVEFTGEHEYSKTGNAIDFDGVSGSDFTFSTTLNLPF